MSLCTLRKVKTLSNAIRTLNYRRTLFYLQTEVYLPIVLNIEENENICIFLNEEVLYC